ncbi:P-loop containing nucleoside triphosphate hydrolase protein [Thamnocephalis sphaerospora]|uniref:P-loop containing nucleoside triphosphate hydrolase protein n=1 Tax=Thamnocephalis sphaerospora TaxID=78915 RepID=A0A4P9XQ48_9FUNG|nr:P-loop containing nucleoside triphosphate hydrolase protein [Thamnocephalis sphaerospora]|eukprot:RKP08155.1 P-loop containing nucleoside triphosphate hydrolase protein [Thamnocephalis sphaerospora]
MVKTTAYSRTHLGTVFTYGQTCSGKTFTMYGAPPKHPGVIPLAVQDIFARVKERPDCEFLFKASFLEIYNEVIRDLLDPKRVNLKIHETPNREIFVGNLSEKPVYSAHEVAELLQKGEANRSIGETNMNERSSRSHTIFRMVSKHFQIASTHLAPSRLIHTTRQLKNLVDLAGSERVGFTKAEGLRLKEGAHINKSLLALGTVISRLAESGGESRGHIPYRDSKLTRILQNALGGNAKTSIICTVTPSEAFADETISTLKFARRAMVIANKPIVNEVRHAAIFIATHKTNLYIYYNTRAAGCHRCCKTGTLSRGNSPTEAAAACSKPHAR